MSTPDAERVPIKRLAPKPLLGQRPPGRRILSPNSKRASHFSLARLVFLKKGSPGSPVVPGLPTVTFQVPTRLERGAVGVRRGEIDRAAAHERPPRRRVSNNGFQLVAKDKWPRLPRPGRVPGSISPELRWGAPSPLCLWRALTASTVGITLPPKFERVAGAQVRSATAN
jgi:hypothetical protein